MFAQTCTVHGRNVPRRRVRRFLNAMDPVKKKTTFLFRSTNSAHLLSNDLRCINTVLGTYAAFRAPLMVFVIFLDAATVGDPRDETATRKTDPSNSDQKE